MNLKNIIMAVDKNTFEASELLAYLFQVVILSKIGMVQFQRICGHSALNVRFLSYNIY